MESQNYSFVVRVWLESANRDMESAVWRGSIEQVGSDSRFYFSDLDGIGRFIQTQIGMKKSSSHPGWQFAWEHFINGIRNFWTRLFHSNDH